MKNILRLEEFAMTLFAIFLFTALDIAWWWFPVLLLAPDLSAIGYLVGTKFGSYTYNFFHHKGVGLLTYVAGSMTGVQSLQLVGLVLFAHSSLDRVFGYGLKHEQSFQHTHLGRIGNAADI